jgi:hypothetical protein
VCMYRVFSFLFISSLFISLLFFFCLIFPSRISYIFTLFPHFLSSFLFYFSFFFPFVSGLPTLLSLSLSSCYSILYYYRVLGLLHGAELACYYSLYFFSVVYRCGICAYSIHSACCCFAAPSRFLFPYTIF